MYVHIYSAEAADPKLQPSWNLLVNKFENDKNIPEGRDQGVGPDPDPFLLIDTGVIPCTNLRQVFFATCLVVSKSDEDEMFLICAVVDQLAVIGLFMYMNIYIFSI